MDKQKLESDISMIEDLILKLDFEIEVIETQIEKNELTSTGSDDYFDWRRRALVSLSYKRTFKNSAKRQLNYWVRLLNGIARKEKEKAREAHVKVLELSLAKSKIKEKEKSERHRISENRKILTANKFKLLIKDMIGADKYIELIREADRLVSLDIKKAP